MFYVRRIWPWGILAWSLAGSITVASLVPSSEDRPEIRIVRDDQQRPIALEAIGFPERELKRLQDDNADLTDFIVRFYVTVLMHDSGEGDETIPVIAGSYTISQSVVRFTPRYPLLPGVDYRVVLRWESDETGDGRVSTPWEKIEADLRLPRAAAATRPKVEHVFPSGSTVPENHLRFYIHFSTPMKKGSAYQFLELRDASGKVVDAAFLELTEELWDPQQKRLTLLLDPGRIKQSLKLREELGAVLKQGHKYQLIVRAGWASADGVQLATDYEHDFAVGAPAVNQLDVHQWKISAPREGTADPLRVQAPVPLDHAIAARSIVVRDAEGDLVPGDVALKDGESTWQFTPKVTWSSGDYWLAIDSQLEDTAGNTVESAFEVEQRFDRSALPRSVNERAILVPVQISVFAGN
jgi:hypothetical protein